MKHALVLLVVCAMCSAGRIHAATLNFEVDANGNTITAPPAPPFVPLTTQYSDWGITFDSTTKVQFHGAPGDLNTPPNSLAADNNDDFVTLDAYFHDPVQHAVDGTVPWVEFFQDRGAQSGGGTFIAYDIDGTEIINAAFNTSGKTFHTFNDWGYVGAIHRVYIGYCKDGIDDLAFGPITAVPLPSAAWIGLSLLGGAGVLRELRRRN